MDKTVINLITILVAGVGVFVALIRFNPPELSMTFWGENLFQVKRNVIENYRTWVFTFLIIVGLLIQVGSIIFLSDIPKRTHSTRFYLLFLIIAFVLMSFITFGLNGLSKLLAKRVWLPRIVKGLTPAYQSVFEITENKGLRTNQLHLREKGQDVTKEVQANYEAAAERLSMIEKLLEVDRTTDDPEERVSAFKKYFP